MLTDRKDGQGLPLRKQDRPKRSAGQGHPSEPGTILNGSREMSPEPRLSKAVLFRFSCNTVSLDMS